MDALEGRRLAAEEAVAARLEATATRARLLAVELGVATDFDPLAWDADSRRRPRGLASAPGRVDREAVAAALGEGRRRLARSAGGALAAGAALLAFVGLGGAARLGRTLARHRLAYAYVVPTMVTMLLVVFLPFAYGVGLSFTHSNLYNLDRPLAELWAGLANYGDILGDFSIVKQTEAGRSVDFENFYWTLGFTVVWTVANVAWGVGIGLILALILNTAGLALRPVYRVLLILPWAVPNYITALIWKGMFHQQLGVINQIVQLLGLAPVAWFEHPFTSFLAIWSTNAWLSFPFMMVISLGALQSIPGELYEAARVDGASRWQQFSAITLPSLKPALVPAIIISVVWTFNMFNIPYLTSAGEPAHSTEILITQGYKIAFQKYQYGYAAAYATIIFLILFAYGTWQNRVTRATESL
jgi:arabinogalactan oligomer/maltooligosaccharide transport system permease protein